MTISDTELSDDEQSNHPNLEGIIDVAQLCAMETPLNLEGVAAEQTIEFNMPTPQNQPDTGSIHSKNSPLTPHTVLKESNLLVMAQETTHKMNGVTHTIEEQANPRESETLYTKEKRKEYDDKERNELLDKIQRNQQTEYHSIAISVNDPEKMTNAHSLAKSLAENKRNLVKCDPHDICTVIVPKTGSFDSNNSEFRQLELNPATSDPIE